MPARVLFDVSFTRMQHGSVGITRTVRRLGAELVKVLPAGSECIPVAFHTTGFRAAEGTPAQAEAPAAGASLWTRLLQRMTQGLLRRVAFGLLPLPVLYAAWRVHSTLSFNAMSASLVPVRFRPGDWLLMCDASWSYRSWLAAAAARRDGARVVVMVHDLIPIRHPEFCVPLYSQMFRRWLQAMVGCTDAMICNSGATEADLRAYAAAEGLRLPPTGHFRLGSDPSGAGSTGQVRPALRAFLGGSAPCFAAIGTIEARKNYGWLLTAFEQLWAAGHDVRLLIVGRPNVDSQALVDRFTAHREQGRRLLTLFDAGDAEIGQAYASARALLFASLAEGFGLPLVEARTRGCPVIAGELPVFAELADRGVFLYPQGDATALQALVLQHAGHDHRPSVGAMVPFTWEDSARDCLQTVSSLLGASRETPAQNHGAPAPGASIREEIRA